MFSGRNMANYPLIILVTPSYLEHCYRVLDKPNIWYNIFVKKHICCGVSVPNNSVHEKDHFRTLHDRILGTAV